MGGIRPGSPAPGSAERPQGGRRGRGSAWRASITPPVPPDTCPRWWHGPTRPWGSPTGCRDKAMGDRRPQRGVEPLPTSPRVVLRAFLPLNHRIPDKKASCHQTASPLDRKIVSFPSALYLQGCASEGYLCRQRRRNESARDFLPWGHGAVRPLAAAGTGINCSPCPLGIGQGVMGLKSQGARLMLGIRKRFLTEQTVNYSDRLPGEALESPSLEIFKTRLGRCPLGIWGAIGLVLKQEGGVCGFHHCPSHSGWGFSGSFP